MNTVDEETVRRAVAFATEKHRGQFRIGGDPYITHPVAVAEIVRQDGWGTDGIVAALFHDLLEDTDAAESEIRAIGGAAVLEAVRRLTKRKGRPMAEYIEAIRANPIAFAVKGADRLHNLTCAVCASEEFKRKYVLESVDWYLDFRREIPGAVRTLVHSMESPLASLPLQYRLINENAELIQPASTDCK